MVNSYAGDDDSIKIKAPPSLLREWRTSMDQPMLILAIRIYFEHIKGRKLTLNSCILHRLGLYHRCLHNGTRIPHRCCFAAKNVVVIFKNIKPSGVTKLFCDIATSTIKNKNVIQFNQLCIYMSEAPSSPSQQHIEHPFWVLLQVGRVGLNGKYVN